MKDAGSPRQTTQAARVSGTRRWAGVLLLGALLSIIGAAVAGLSIVAGSRAPATVAREPVELQVKGDFTHPAGFVMPEKAGPFERHEVVQYDQLGRDVSAGYNAFVREEARLPIVVDLYVYPASPTQDLGAQFDTVIREIGRSHGAARPELRKNVHLGPKHSAARYAVFGYAEPWGGATEDVPLRSFLILYRWNGWWVKWRATTPAPVDPERMRAIVDLTESVLRPRSSRTNPGSRPRAIPKANASRMLGRRSCRVHWQDE